MHVVVRFMGFDGLVGISMMLRLLVAWVVDTLHDLTYAIRGLFLKGKNCTRQCKLPEVFSQWH